MNVLWCLTLCGVVVLIDADTLKFHPRARGKLDDRSWKPQYSEIQQLLQEIGEKGTKLQDFNFKDCGGNTGSTFQLTVSPDPVSFPGTITISAKVDLNQTISSPLSAVLRVQKKMFGTWMEVPCIDNIGSCTYHSLCDILNTVPQCPPELVSAGINCKCPINARTYQLSKMSIEIDAAVVPMGDYKVNGTLSFGAGGKYHQCLEMQFSIAN